MTEENRDFKYVMQDVSKVYIGAKYTYQEMMDTDEIPFKLKAILSHYILKEVAGILHRKIISFISKTQICPIWSTNR